ncbi:hypothetical protein HWC07_gp004 [Pantoea phage vB_PagM_LIET2]|uniref:Uncharacterized protein n=1 Tax=Pantoea phage vB_PagM_LIET2 TaxID=2508071 RepID=A0A411AVZ0_9CAUD|nr:hypothetical protein HWC07_gp004 [Pantoea phage vB_PagM_LIET2]QAX92256.1 hypothetical protein LIET2_gp004 [Pantoea phage vB_PagM_LIET2]
MTKAIGPLKGVDLVNAIDYRIESLRVEINKATSSRDHADRLVELAQELKEAYRVRGEIQWRSEYVAVPPVQDVLDDAGGLAGAVAADDREQFDLANEQILTLARGLVWRYVCNADTDNEFIACITPERSSIGTGGVWDEWRMLRRLLNEVPKRQD